MSHFPDERLKLPFVCGHPAVDVAARTPLMLQSVLGIDAARIGSAFPGVARGDEPAAGSSEE